MSEDTKFEVSCLATLRLRGFALKMLTPWKRLPSVGLSFPNLIKSRSAMPFGAGTEIQRQKKSEVGQ